MEIYKNNNKKQSYCNLPLPFVDDALPKSLIDRTTVS